MTAADNKELDAIVRWLEQKAPMDVVFLSWYDKAAGAIRALRARVAELQDKYEACKLQAQCWSHEAKAQRSTVLESYQAASGASGEPGDWNGAEPIRRLVERAELAESQLQQVKADAERLKIEVEAANKKARRNGKYADQVERAERAERLLAENNRTNNA